jgi:AGZA family xanthine/uracil permease-like MFS transporter
VLTFLILDLFDTIGTLIGVAGEANLLRDGKLPRAEKALFADAAGTVTGALLGTSTITSYVESAAGVASGARTGLASVVTAVFFILAIFCYPLVTMISGGVPLADGFVSYPTIAPVLIIVGIFLIKNIRSIPWENLSESIPAFITIVFITFSFRITEGIALGFIAYSLLKLFTGQIKEVPWMMWIFTLVFILRYAFFNLD